MGRAIELSDVHDVAFVLQNGCFIVIYVEIIRSGENGHNGWKTGGFGLAIHAISVTI